MAVYDSIMQQIKVVATEEDHSKHTRWQRRVRSVARFSTIRCRQWGVVMMISLPLASFT